MKKTTFLLLFVAFMATTANASSGKTTKAATWPPEWEIALESFKYWVNRLPHLHTRKCSQYCPEDFR